MELAHLGLKAFNFRYLLHHKKKNKLLIIMNWSFNIIFLKVCITKIIVYLLKDMIEIKVKVDMLFFCKHWE